MFHNYFKINDYSLVKLTGKHVKSKANKEKEDMGYTNNSQTALTYDVSKHSQLVLG